ncbi:MAG: hypothetical protein EA356_01375 [Geminicoccaceae bacterium]|nr:MAG: hypothetical protein EA356_01375 [Geminicoccaceae bacterium]
MLRTLALIACLAFAAVPASAAVVVAPGDQRTLLTTEAFTGSMAGATFELTQDMSFVAINALANQIGLDLASVQLANGTTIDLPIINAGSAMAFASFEGPLAAGTYMLIMNGSFSNAGLQASISAVPLPGAVVLFGTAVAGLVYARRRKAVSNA